MTVPRSARPRRDTPPPRSAEQDRAEPEPYELEHDGTRPVHPNERDDDD